MADIRNTVVDPSSTIFRLSALSTKRPTQTYQSVTNNEIDSTSNHSISINRRYTLRSKNGIRNIDEVPSQQAWLHQSFWKDTCSDVKNLPWKSLILPTLAHILLCFILSGLIILLCGLSFFPGLIYSSDICKPDGTFELSFNRYSLWKRDAVFAINLNFGSYSFDDAKLIDICWDVVGLDQVYVPCSFTNLS